MQKIVRMSDPKKNARELQMASFLDPGGPLSAPKCVKFGICGHLKNEWKIKRQKVTKSYKKRPQKGEWFRAECFFWTPISKPCPNPPQGGAGPPESSIFIKIWQKKSLKTHASEFSLCSSQLLWRTWGFEMDAMIGHISAAAYPAACACVSGGRSLAICVPVIILVISKTVCKSKYTTCKTIIWVRSWICVEIKDLNLHSFENISKFQDLDLHIFLDYFNNPRLWPPYLW